MLPDGLRDYIPRVAAATYEHFEACLTRVPEPARSELRRLGGLKAKTQDVSVVAKVILVLAYDLGIRDERILARINNASALGVVHSVILDDVVDNKGIGPRAAIRNVYLAHMVFNFY